MKLDYLKTEHGAWKAVCEWFRTDTGTSVVRKVYSDGTVTWEKFSPHMEARVYPHVPGAGCSWAEGLEDAYRVFTGDPCQVDMSGAHYDLCSLSAGSGLVASDRDKEPLPKDCGSPECT